MSGGLWRIGKTFRFEATRTVTGRQDTGASRYDGHSFVAEVVLTAPRLTKVGFVVDFGELAPLSRHIDTVLDHQNLSQRLPDASNEGIGRYLTAWAREHLPAEAVSALEHVQIRAGRPSAPQPGAMVTFEATHRLEGLASDHPCGRLHGHSYLVTVAAADRHGQNPRPAEVPMLLRRYIRSTLHDAVLNEAVDFNPTCELLAHHLTCWLEDRAVTGPGGLGMHVRVSETATSWAAFEGHHRDRT
ncbi:6-pyruvoyl trahydropterin synthase family protein [Actinomadura coerulea]|uniref:6-pyruvoyl trahydropterin synthase family protein n=1 Tax=Actinomadura coerulea TaxID=46159 RepID=UPI003425242C